MIDDLEIVGLTGLAGSGKDTAAHILVGEYGFVRVALADGVRGALRDLDGPGWDITKRGGLTVRRALQLMGTEYGRDNVNPDLWCEVLEAKLWFLREWARRSGESLRVVVPDVRLLDEADYLQRTARCTIVRLTRPGAGLMGETADHRSELESTRINANVLIKNDGSRSELRDKVSKLFEL